MSLTVWTFDVWRSSAPSQKPVHASAATKMGQQQQRKQRLEDDKLGRFPVVASRSAEESLSRSNFPPNALSDADMASQQNEASFTGQQESQASNEVDWAPFPPNPSNAAPSKEPSVGSFHSLSEGERSPFPVDPPAFDATDGVRDSNGASPHR